MIPTVEFNRGVPFDIRVAVRQFIDRVIEVSPVRHRLRILVVPHDSVQTPEGTVAFAAFDCKTRFIVVGAGLAKLCAEQFEDTRENAVLAVIETLAHEYAHYEQFRDKRPLQERGVQVRAKSLMRKCGMFYSAA